MRYTVKTVYGISEESYRGTLIEPLFGTGQGSGASPAVWLSLVVILLQTLDRLIPDRVNFSCPSGAITHQRLADAFVDDTALFLHPLPTTLLFNNSSLPNYKALLKPGSTCCFFPVVN